MKNKKKVTLLASLCLVGVLAVGGTLAYFTAQDNVENTFTMGEVAIKLTEPEFSKNTDNTIKDIAPNKTVAKDPTVTVNDGSLPAYVRLNLEITGVNDAQKVDLLNAIIAELNEGWVMVDNTLYFNTELKANEKSTAFDEITIPATWGNEIKGMTFKINITADAVQADYFTPTKDATGNIIAWPGVTITK